MKWVTREHVHVDRTACPWLIEKFVDPRAEFIFVPPERIQEVVKEQKAIPYDTSGAELGHQGDMCSFDAIVRKYNVKDPGVLKLAEIVRAADTDRPGAPEATGLEAIMTGLSLNAKDDYEAIARAAPVYDALYTFCRLRLIREKYKSEIEKMDGTERREFLRRKLLK